MEINREHQFNFKIVSVRAQEALVLFYLPRVTASGKFSNTKYNYSYTLCVTLFKN